MVRSKCPEIDDYCDWYCIVSGPFKGPSKASIKSGPQCTKPPLLDWDCEKNQIEVVSQ